MTNVVYIAGAPERHFGHRIAVLQLLGFAAFILWRAHVAPTGGHQLAGLEVLHRLQPGKGVAAVNHRRRVDRHAVFRHKSGGQGGAANV